MYRINDEIGYIRSIQELLLIISGEREEIQPSPVDGIYGEETRDAIKAFQAVFQTEITGIVDKETYDFLYADARRILGERDARSKAYEKELFPLSIGSYGHDVALLNTYLYTLSEYYELVPVPTDDFFSRDTENAVSLMQGYFREEITGKVSHSLLERLKDETNLRKIFKAK